MYMLKYKYEQNPTEENYEAIVREEKLVDYL
jgi:hypothetical protein